MAAEWYYRSGAREIGPLSFHDLTTVARQGRIDPATEIRQGPGGKWIRADSVAGLIGGAGPFSRSIPPPLPSAGQSISAGGETSAFDLSVRKPSSAARAPLSVGLLSLAICAVVVLLFSVVILAVRLGDSAPAPAVSPSVPSQPANHGMPAFAAAKAAPAAAPHRRRFSAAAPPAAARKAPAISLRQTAGANDDTNASQSSGNWMERVDEKSHDSVVVIVNVEGSSLGTGFVIAAEGNRKLLLTNKHVMRIGDDPDVDPLARGCYLKTVSGHVIKARLAAEARDSAVDLALVVADSDELRPLGRVRSFADIHVGENVVTLGNPGIPGTDLILEGTMTPGIVSGKRGEMLIQTTAPINHGNSGGPLVNESGQIIGVNTFSAKNMQATNFAFRADWVFDTNHWNYYQDISRLMSAIPRP